MEEEKMKKLILLLCALLLCQVNLAIAKQTPLADAVSPKCIDEVYEVCPELDDYNTMKCIAEKIDEFTEKCREELGIWTARASAPPKDNKDTTEERFNNLMGDRYTEIFLIGGNPNTEEYIGGVYNTIGENDDKDKDDTCPQDILDNLDLQALARKYDVLSVYLNGPRLWTLDWLDIKMGKPEEFQELKTHWVTWLHVPSGFSDQGAPPYKPMEVERDTVFEINKDSYAYILDHTVGDTTKTYVMKSASLIKDPNQTLETLQNDLGKELAPLPEGWTYRCVQLNSELEMTPVGGKAEIVCDSKGNTYDLTGGDYSNYVP
jgi:hypothetical protein